VCIRDPDNVTAVGEYGIILRTTNGGDSWSSQIIGTTNWLSSVHFVDINTGWAVGDSGSIYHTTNGGVSFVEENEIGEMPTEFSLSQNWPNPFNSSSVIRYSIPQSSNVVIKIFDVLGNEKGTLINDEKSAGSYEIMWYAENLPSGIYFYQLKADNYIETKKMILLK